MDIYSKIKDAIREIAGKELSWLRVAKVVSCNGYKCTVMIGSLRLEDVRLRAVVNDKEDKVLLTPKIGSMVLVYDLSAGRLRDLVVLSMSEVEKIEIKAGNTTIDIDNNGIILNGGNLDGLVKAQALTDRLNALENDINNLKSAALGWMPVPQDGGEALKVALSAWTGSQLTITQKSDIENTKIKH